MKINPFALDTSLSIPHVYCSSLDVPLLIFLSVKNFVITWRHSFSTCVCWNETCMCVGIIAGSTRWWSPFPSLPLSNTLRLSSVMRNLGCPFFTPSYLLRFLRAQGFGSRIVRPSSPSPVYSGCEGAWGLLSIKAFCWRQQIGMSFWNK